MRIRFFTQLYLPYWPVHWSLPLSGQVSSVQLVTLKGRLYVTEFDIGEFFIHGEAREIDGEFQAVIVMRAKPPLKTVTTHQVEKDRWFKTADAAATAAKESALALKTAVDSGALTS